jgi:WD40 repeat protein
MERSIKTLAISRDGKLMCIGESDSHCPNLSLYSTSGERLATLGGHPYDICDPRHLKCKKFEDISAVAFSAAGDLVASAAKKEVRIWDTAQATLLYTLPNQGCNRKGDALVFSPDGKRLAVVSWKTIDLWDLTTRQLQARLAASDRGQVISITFSPDGQTLASGDSAGAVQLWHLPTEQPTLAFNLGTQVNSVTFAAKGHVLAAMDSAGHLHLWRTAPHY